MTDGPGFSWPLALRMLNAAICAYKVRAKGVEKPHDEPIARSVPADDGKVIYDVVPFYQDAVGFIEGSESYTPAFTAIGPDRIDAALCGRTHDGYAVLSFRGTLAPNVKRGDTLEWLLDWLEDADAVQEPWHPGGVPKGEVESGFADALDALWPWVEEQMSHLLAQSPEGLLITGHSKGAAMTFLAASRILDKWPELERRIAVYAFAPPVAGDAEFARTYGALDRATYRFQAEDDLVPFLPRWDDYNVWERLRFSHLYERLFWAALVKAVDKATGSGYSAVGQMFFMPEKGPVDSAPDAAEKALDLVVATLEKEHWAQVADAHSAVNSYLPKVRDAAGRADD